MTTDYSFKSIPISNDECLTQFYFYNKFPQNIHRVINIYQSNENLPEIKQSKLNKVHTKQSHYAVTQGFAPSV